MHETRRSSHEERGLKYGSDYTEMGMPGRSSHEERGLKYGAVHRLEQLQAGRSSHEERGLKYGLQRGGKKCDKSLLA